MSNCRMDVSRAMFVLKLDSLSNFMQDTNWCSNNALELSFVFLILDDQMVLEVDFSFAG